MKHSTRSSDSNFYDIVCTVCGGTDAIGDDRLKYPCVADPDHARLQLLRRRELEQVNDLDKLRADIALHVNMMKKKGKL